MGISSVVRHRPGQELSRGIQRNGPAGSAVEVTGKHYWPLATSLRGCPEIARLRFDPLTAGQRKHVQRLLRCERYRAIAGIHSQENRRIYRQFDVGTFGDECAAESFCGAKVSESD